MIHECQALYVQNQNLLNVFKIQNLCGIIIRSGTESLTRNRDSSLDPLRWKNFVTNIFNTLLKISDLKHFLNVNERQQNINVREHIQNEKEAADYIENEIRNLFHTKEVRISEDMRQWLEKTLTLLKVSDTIRERSLKLLNAQVTEMFRALHSSAEIETERERMTVLVLNGEDELKALIDSTSANDSITHEQSA